MDSINRNQPEQNRQDLHGQGAVDKIQAIVKDAENCFFCTKDDESGSESFGSSRPMNVRQCDDHGQLWFLSASDSFKNQDVSKVPQVRLYFQGSKHSEFLVLDGTVTVSTDKEKIRELWEPILKTWFTGGIDDPRITVICFRPASGYYWDTKHGSMVAGIKMVIGAMTGTTLDDSIEGTLRP